MLHFGRNEVRDALQDGRPVVALETAVLTHGLPAPANLEAMMSMQSAVREAGAIPAVVGVVEGKLVVGLRPDQVDGLASGRAAKASARDLAAIIAARGSAGTTVAATLVACRLAGIRVFATGGIGGVHRGWTERPDISADLLELARTACCVVASGAKAILDLPATLEALETLGVPVIGWRTERFPQFFSAGSDSLTVETRLDELDEVAEVCRVRRQELRQEGGVLLANPPPAEQALSQEELDDAVAEALRCAEEEGVRGAALTPFLLDALNTLTAGRTLRANLALLQSNARLAGELAVEMAERVGSQ